MTVKRRLEALEAQERGREREGHGIREQERQALRARLEEPGSMGLRLMLEYLEGELEAGRALSPEQSRVLDGLRAEGVKRLFE
jgi:hypothetical protein